MAWLGVLIGSFQLELTCYSRMATRNQNKNEGIYYETNRSNSDRLR